MVLGKTPCQRLVWNAKCVWLYVFKGQQNQSCFYISVDCDDKSYVALTPFLKCFRWLHSHLFSKWDTRSLLTGKRVFTWWTSMTFKKAYLVCPHPKLHPHAASLLSSCLPLCTSAIYSWCNWVLFWVLFLHTLPGFHFHSEIILWAQSTSSKQHMYIRTKSLRLNLPIFGHTNAQTHFWKVGHFSYAYRRAFKILYSHHCCHNLQVLLHVNDLFLLQQ